jgi:hypothetical protein
VDEEADERHEREHQRRERVQPEGDVDHPLRERPGTCPTAWFTPSEIQR